MSLFYQIRKFNSILSSDTDWLIPKLNKLYDIESNAKRLFKYSRFGMKCDYASINSNCIPEKNMKQASGFGICFSNRSDIYKRIIIFHDLINPEYIDMAIGHEYAHLKNGDEKEAFTLELQIAKIVRKKLRYLDYNQREYPWRIKQFKKYGLIN